MADPLIVPGLDDPNSTSDSTGFYAQFIKNLAPGLLSNVLPSPKQTGAAGYIPGSVAGIYAMGDLVSRGAQNLIMLPTKYFSPDTWANFKSTPLPGADTAHKIIDESMERSRDLLGVAPPDPTSLTERAGAMAGIAAGGMGLPVSTGSKVVNNLAAIVNPVSAVGPIGKAVLPLAGAGLGMGAEVVTDAAMADSLKALQPQPRPVAPVPLADFVGPPAPPSQPAQPQQVMEQKPVPLQEFTQQQPISLQEFTKDNTGLPDQKMTSMTGTTYGDVAVGALAVASILAGTSQAIKLLRNYKTAYIEDVTRSVAAEQDAVARGAPGAANHAVGQPTLPGVMPTDRAVAATVDNSVPLQQVVKATAPDKMTGDVLSARVGNLANQGGYTARLQAFVDTGFDPNASKRYPAWGDHWRNVERMPDNVRNNYSEAAALRDELDNRKLTGGTPHNFPEIDNTALRLRISQLMADPDVAGLIHQRKAITDNVTDWLVDRGMLTRAEASRLRATHPSFMPSANERGLIDNPLSSRDLTPYGGESTQTLKVWEADKQHVDAIFRAVERNEMQNIIVNSLLDFQRRNPNAAKWVSHSPSTGIPGQAGNTAQDVLHLSTRQNGVLNNYRIHSKELYDYVDGIGQRLYLPVLSETRQLMQSFTTGPLGWLLGNFRAAAIASYNGAMSGVTRPAGTSFGYIDKALNAATKGKLGYRGDPTGLLIGQPFAIASDTMSMLAKGLGQALAAGATNPINTNLRKLIGDAATDFVASNMRKRWEASQLHERRSHGVSGSAGFGSTEPPTSAKLGVGPASGADKLNNMYPDLFRRYSRLPLGNSLPMFVRVGQIAHQVNQAITESHAAHYWALNRGKMPKAQLVRETRRLSGDIGEIGSSKVVQAANQSIPYFTPSVQGGRRILSEMQKHPFATTAGIVNTLIIPILASIFTAMIHGDTTMDDLTNGLNAERGSAVIPIYTGPDPTTDKINIPLEHSLRGPYALLSSTFHDMFRIMHDSGMEGKQAVLHAMSSIFDKFISTTDADKMITGASAMFSTSPPPLVDGLMNTANVSLPVDWLSRTIQGEKAWVNSEIKRSIPGVVDSVDPITGASYNNAIFGVISALTGAASTTFKTLWHSGANTYAKTGDIGDAVYSAVEAYKQNLGDSSGAGMLWGHRSALPMRSGPIEQTERKLQALSEASGASNAVALGGQVTRRRGELVSPGMAMQSKIPSDPVMAALYQTVGKYGAVATKLAAPATDAKKQMDTLRSSGLPPQEQRARLNEQTRIYADRMSRVGDYLNSIEGILSERLGKQIVLEEIDWKRGLDQFRDLPSQ